VTPEDDLPVTIYVGGHDDSLFLTTLLEGSGIAANFVQSRNAAQPHCVKVARRDLERAIPLVEDFKRRSNISGLTQ
jgi:hypothetical protein